MTTTLRQVLIFAALMLAVAFAYRVVTFQPVMRQLVGLPPIPASVQFPDKR
jgi:hypothetical protein